MNKINHETKTPTLILYLDNPIKVKPKDILWSGKLNIVQKLEKKKYNSILCENYNLSIQTNWKEYGHLNLSNYSLFFNKYGTIKTQLPINLLKTGYIYNRSPIGPVISWWNVF